MKKAINLLIGFVIILTFCSCASTTDNATFKTPQIKWVNFYDEFRGFQDSGYIFLTPDTERKGLLATIVHEWIHF